jgi:hypothetical protein
VYAAPFLIGREGVTGEMGRRGEENGAHIIVLPRITVRRVPRVTPSPTPRHHDQKGPY